MRNSRSKDAMVNAEAKRRADGPYFMKRGQGSTKKRPAERREADVRGGVDYRGYLCLILGHSTRKGECNHWNSDRDGELKKSERYTPDWGHLWTAVRFPALELSKCTPKGGSLLDDMPAPRCGQCQVKHVGHDNNTGFGLTRRVNPLYPPLRGRAGMSFRSGPAGCEKRSVCLDLPES